MFGKTKISLIQGINIRATELRGPVVAGLLLASTIGMAAPPGVDATPAPRAAEIRWQWYGSRCWTIRT